MFAKSNIWLSLLMAASLTAFGGCGDKAGVESKALPELGKITHAYITTQDTIVRSGPGTQFKALAKIGPEAKIDIVAREGDWLLIVSSRGNAPGFIDSATARPAGAESEQASVSAGGPYEVLDDTQVRRGPGVHYEAVANVSKGIKINVVGAEEGWLKVQSKHGKPTGYIDPSHARPIAVN